jgi:hypothetical protein
MVAMTWMIVGLVGVATAALLRRLFPRMHGLLQLAVVVVITFTLGFAFAFTRGFLGAFTRSLDGPEFKASFVRSAIESCRKEAVKGGVPEAKAVSFCTCYAQYLADHHTGPELTRYSLNVNASEAQKAFGEAMAACKPGQSKTKAE